MSHQKIPRSAYLIFTVLIVIFFQFVTAAELEIIVESEDRGTREWAAKAIPSKGLLDPIYFFL